MATLIIYLLLVVVIVYFISARKRAGTSSAGTLENKKLPSKMDAEEVWKQVYETASMEEACLIRARLSEEAIESMLYEQGRKDIHGNALKGVGVAVPGAAASRAQATIAKIPV